MLTSKKDLGVMTVGDLMRQDIPVLPLNMPIRKAVNLLLQSASNLAPVVNDQGACVGVVSASHFLSLAGKPDAITRAPALPITCSYQRQHHDGAGKEVTWCTLPSGVCPLQIDHGEVAGKPMIRCADPHCVPCDWQIVEVETPAEEEVRHYMSTAPVTVTPDMSLPALARMLAATRAQTAIVLDGQNRPVGLVSTIDVLEWLAEA